MINIILIYLRKLGGKDNPKIIIVTMLIYQDSVMLGKCCYLVSSK